MLVCCTLFPRYLLSILSEVAHMRGTALNPIDIDAGDVDEKTVEAAASTSRARVVIAVRELFDIEEPLTDLESDGDKSPVDNINVAEECEWGEEDAEGEIDPDYQPRKPAIRPELH